VIDGAYLLYLVTDAERAKLAVSGPKRPYAKDGKEYSQEFVARFKYAAQRKRRPDFRKFLVDNVSVEDYFYELNFNKKAPLQILWDKGYRKELA
jgi:hypothetical protein